MKGVYLLLLSGVLAACITSNASAASEHTLVNSSANSGGDTASASYKASVSLGESIVGACSSSLYKSSLGFLPSVKASAASFVSNNLDSVFVYPNPYKPSSGGIYDSDHITFKKLSSKATIKIFNIALEHIATLEKDSSNDEYKWNAKNDSGATVASGLYLYFVSDPDGHKAKGKFVIIR